MAVVSDHLDTTIRWLFINDDDAQELIDLLNGSSSLVTLIALIGALPQNIYRVDTTATPDQAAARVYPTADAAVAAAEATALTSYVLWFTEGQAHAAWTGAGFTGTKSIAFMCAADRGATVPITLAAPLPAPTGVQSIRFARVDVAISASVDVNGYLVAAVGCRLRSSAALGALVELLGDLVTIIECDVVDVTIVGANAAIAIVSRRSTYGYTPQLAGQAFTATGVAVVDFVDNSVDVNLTPAVTFSIFGHLGGGATPALVAWDGRATLRGAVGSTIALMTGAYASGDYANFDVTRTSLGTVNFGKAGLTGTVNWHGTDPDDGNLPTGSWHNVAGTISQV